MKSIRVMIVEDSTATRELLEHIIGSDPRLEVAASVASAEEALRILERVSPDVISMDIRLPGMSGVEATRLVMRRKPTPIVVLSASVDAEFLEITMKALQAGALTVLEKPRGTLHADYEAEAGRICTQLVIMSEIKVVGQRGFLPKAARVREDGPVVAGKDYVMVGVVSSTGGPSALSQLLNGLGPGFPLPVLLVQHITASFLEGFVRWLNEVSPLPATIIENGQAPEPGKVHLAPVDRHLKIRQGRLWADDGPAISSQRPSGTALFRSMAKELGPTAVAVLLTGMGEDGAEGLLDVRSAGGYTIAEDESTAVVYGMPAAAGQLKAACEFLPLPLIAPRLRHLLSPKQEPIRGRQSL